MDGESQYISTSEIEDDAVTGAKIDQETVTSVNVQNYSLGYQELDTDIDAIPTDEYLLAFESTGTTLKWVDPSSIGGGSKYVIEEGGTVQTARNALNFNASHFSLTGDAANDEIDIDIANNAINTAQLFDESVTNLKLADDAVTTAKIAITIVTGKH